jgi:hypothetical protein
MLSSKTAGAGRQALLAYPLRHLNPVWIFSSIRFLEGSHVRDSN